MSRNFHARLGVALFGIALAVLSCRSGDSTAPAMLPALPADSQPRLTLNLPAGQAMTAGTTERITLDAANVKARQCRVTGPDWLGLAPVANQNSAWTVAPTASGAAALVATCVDGRNRVIGLTDTLMVYDQPTVTPGISGTVPVDVGDSIAVQYDSTNTQRIDVTCSQCDSAATLRRVGANTMRLVATRVPADTLTRGVCFTALGLDGRFTRRQCVPIAIMPAQAALYTVPAAIRAAEVVSLHAMPVATYDGSGQSTHPDFMRVSAPWAAGTCWMAFTPYYQSNGWLENPSLATSPDCEHWSPAAGVATPLIAKPANGYNSDPDLMYDEVRGCLGVVFRQVYAQNVIMLTSSCDGKTFSAPRQLFSAPNHSAVSPTVSRGPDGVQRAWYVDAGISGCTAGSSVVKLRAATTDSSGLDGIQFGPESPTDLVQPGYVVWHIRVRWVAALKQYVALYAAFPQTTGIGNCMNDDLFLATSADGVHWRSFQSPVLNHLDNRFTFASLYRASFQYEAATDRLRTIVSGLDAAGNWGQYGVVHGFTALAAALESSWTVASAQLVPSPDLVRKPDRHPRKVILEDRQ